MKATDTRNGAGKNGQQQKSKPPSDDADQDDDRKAEFAARRKAQSEKMAWVKALLADPAVGDAPKVVGSTAALNLAYSHGRFRATYKELGRLSGKNARGAKNAAEILAELNYWDVETIPGAASRYHLVPPDLRLERWLDAEHDQIQDWVDAESEWRNTCRKWNSAKENWEYQVRRWLDKEAIHLWLTAEAAAKDEYTGTVFSAVYKRAEFETAVKVAEQAWKMYQESVAQTAEEVAQEVEELSDDRFREVFGRFGPLTIDATDEFATQPLDDENVQPNGWGQPLYDQNVHHNGWGEPLTNTLTSGNNPSTSCSRNTKCDEEQQASLPLAPRAETRALARSEKQTPTAAADGSALACQLCDDDGIALTRDLDPDTGTRQQITIGFIAGDDGLETIQRPFKCRHSVTENTAAIIQMERNSGSDYLGPSWTGYPGIDGPAYDEF